MGRGCETGKGMSNPATVVTGARSCQDTCVTAAMFCRNIMQALCVLEKFIVVMLKKAGKISLKNIYCLAQCIPKTIISTCS